VRQVTLALGGARSGKSRFAEELAERSGPLRTYIATAEAFDGEMQSRIDKHRARRGEGWQTIEAPLALSETLAACGSPVVLVDCLTLWISNLMFRDRDVASEINLLCAALERASGHVILVSNEVGMGIVPENALSRGFRDMQGLANQKVAAVADAVYFVAAGLPLTLKTPATEAPAR
jgi:adenosylcobinamide kinase / adenosylcobinamide-phosphate guanylyltransferase